MLFSDTVFGKVTLLQVERSVWCAVGSAYMLTVLGEMYLSRRLTANKDLFEPCSAIFNLTLAPDTWHLEVRG